ncbi:MAG: hypothetical protein D6707_12485 [Bacteroidetes bacterium]|nr:MAG: hypothetical protein D6707_12485 [Bacteroidota bacterium]
MVFHNYEYITSENDIVSFLGQDNLKDVTTDEDQDPDFPIPHYTKVFNFEAREAYLGILDVSFSLSNRLLNARILLHFGDNSNIDTAKMFYEKTLLPYIKKELSINESAPNPMITGHTFWQKNLEVTARWVTNMPSVATYLTLID